MQGIQQTITTLEIAEMMEMEHWKVLRKLEGQEKEGKHIKGYIEILTDNQIVVSDFFIQSSYRDASGKENKCYAVTRLGCDFLANKFTGEKGVIFTARYVKRFRDMDNIIQQKVYETKATSLGEIASYTKEMGKRLEKQGTEPWKIAEAFKMVSEQFGIQLPDDFVKVPRYNQLILDIGGSRNE